ncbi:uncharacterized protein DUF4238 [Leucobacter luti]|uniref:Uncharacterized protein DUF4238 n=1 Tax=Leucobacter luti TaxID=340320 RepID=A0A4R6S5K0_9MICO|nr:DUF4238 domain-containing protein [Leucobacter luti]TDP94613.1 uncharacterized protein DUF4238 [Leucobacter luti]
MSISAVKNAHMIPACYLRAWEDEKSEVYVADLVAERPLILRTSKATVVNYAYKPAVLKHDREAHYAAIEDRGIVAIREAAKGSVLNSDARLAVIEFFDMFQERGIHADHASLSVPVVMGSQDSEELKDLDMNLGDMITLHRDLNPDLLNLKDQHLEDRPWKVITQPAPMMTGDAAVIPILGAEDDELIAVLFPLSPMELLVIGDVPENLKLNITQYIAMKSRRWLVGRVEDAPGWVVEAVASKRTRK